MSGAALLLTRGSLAAAASVLAGGTLMAVSYVTMKASVDGIVALFGGDGTRRSRAHVGRIALKMAGRYALLALLAYVMIARLRLQPVGLMAGVSSVVAAASIEAIRLQLQKKPKA